MKYFFESAFFAWLVVVLSIILAPYLAACFIYLEPLTINIGWRLWVVSVVIVSIVPFLSITPKDLAFHDHYGDLVCGPPPCNFKGSNDEKETKS